MITVSVCMITYNHENYIKEAINGVLMQKTDFNVELIISNDCSPDGTDEVVREIIKTHPKGYTINYVNHKKNLGIMPNLLFTVAQCKGDYIAMCEGDDYWITPDKLQKQVEVFKTNSNLGLVYTGVKFYHQKENQFVAIPSRFPKKEENTIPLMLESKYIEFATTLFDKDLLNKVLETIKPELENAVIGDTRILLEAAYQSKIYFIEEVTTVYRVAEGSASYPKQLNKYVFALLDTYICRKNFVLRNNINPKLLGYSVCNTNKNLVNQAFVSTNYKDVLYLLKELLVKDSFKFCTWKIVKKKISITLILKLILGVLGIGVLRQKVKN